jgi:hypothetical protein
MNKEIGIPLASNVNKPNVTSSFLTIYLIELLKPLSLFKDIHTT